MSVPNHIGIIMDGNRRFSRRLMLKPWKGHEWGAKKIAKVLEWCREYGIRELTLYTFSIQNFNRPKEEFDYLMDLFRTNFEKMKDDKKILDTGIRVNIIGRTWMFPRDVQEKMQAVMDKTRHNSKYILNFAMAYGGREEVIDAARKIAEQVKSGKLDVSQINDETFSRCLYMSDEPDLIIRTGGEQRTSNFLAYQGAYSEYFFIDKMWPEFSKADFRKVLKDYGDRERRFGR
jgi:tritrans,polycis-undecaprenyl-diphosphate synthase [geranylgeranyl-diphosphate specific]